MQAGIGNVVAGSLFAFGQSAAAGGAAAGTVAAAGGVTAGATAGYTLIKDGWSWLKNNPAFSSQGEEKRGESA